MVVLPLEWKLIIISYQLAMVHLLVVVDQLIIHYHLPVDLVQVMVQAYNHKVVIEDQYLVEILNHRKLVR